MHAPPTPSSPISLRSRWIAWHVVIVALLVFTPAWLLIAGSGRSRAAWVGYAVVCSLHAALAWLLVTTPHDAIRLDRQRSDRMIVAATCLLFAASLACVPTMSLAFASTSTLSAMVIAFLLTRLMQQLDVSAWWSVLLVWNPTIFFLIVQPRA